MVENKEKFEDFTTIVQDKEKLQQSTFMVKYVEKVEESVSNIVDYDCEKVEEWTTMIDFFTISSNT